MSTSGALLGAEGEEEARRRLEARGYRVLERNVRIGGAELDLVCRHGDEVVVVEVRTRSVGVLQPPEETVGPVKLRRLVRAGRSWVVSRGWKGPWRIDLVGFTVDRNGEWHESHLRDITAGMVCE
ncbi:YraN family protein [Aminiphilus sp.]|jgi:putative endonuclease|uniref:YraN family protein n=1 Tax=Aminiphilus sp. TaxID=1872488 RepID=UPI00260C9464|nr:YraN family protein [Aminiphilus sp.]